MSRKLNKNAQIGNSLRRTLNAAKPPSLLSGIIAVELTVGKKTLTGALRSESHK